MPCGNDGQHPSSHIINPFALETCPDVLCDPHAVAHHLIGFVKHALVDLLVHIAHANPALIVFCGVGLVDVADLAEFGVPDLAVDLELLGNVAKLFLVYGKGFTCCRV